MRIGVQIVLSRCKSRAAVSRKTKGRGRSCAAQIDLIGIGRVNLDGDIVKTLPAAETVTNLRRPGCAAPVRERTGAPVLLSRPRLRP